MSKRLQHFVNNFVLGARLGLHWKDLAERAEDRKQQREIASEKNRIDAQRHRDRMAIDTTKADAYVRDINAKIAGTGYYNRAKAGSASGQLLDPGTQAYMERAAQRGDVASGGDSGPAQVQQTTTDEPPTPEPATTIETNRRGGRVGGGVSRMASGGKARRQQMVGQMMRAGQSAADRMHRIGQTGTPPIMPPSAGTNGPGSGYGETAAPPVTAPAINTNYPLDQGTYRQGGRVARAQSGGSMKDYYERENRRQAEFDADKEHQTASRNLDRAFGYDRMLIGQSRDYDAPLTVRNTGMFNYKPPKERPLKQKSWSEHALPDEPPITETGGTPEPERRVRRYQDGGNVIPEDYVDDPTLSPEERQARWKAALFPPARRAEPPMVLQPGIDGPSGGAQAAQAARARRQAPSSVDQGENWDTTRTPQRPVGMAVSRVDEDPIHPARTYLPDQPPQGDSPDQYYQDDPRTKYKPWATNLPKRGAGQPRQGVNTASGPWKALDDQTRVEAYDPHGRDLYDKHNVFPVDREGRSQPWTQQQRLASQGTAAAGVPRERTPPSGEVDVRGGAQAGMSSNNAAADYQSGATEYAKTLVTNHPQDLYSGAGTPDPRVVDQIMKVIDPQGQMQPGQRYEAAIRTVHEWYMQQGQPQAANQAAGEIAQAGIQQSRPYGAQALKALQAGNMQGAAQLLIQGFSMVPNGQKAEVQGNNLVVSGAGKPTMTIPLTPQMLQSLAMGMMTGKLGWDAMGFDPTGGAVPQARPGAQPPPTSAGRPAAQPSAAPAGPTQTPAAQQTAINPEIPLTMGRYLPPETPPPGSTPDPTSPAPQEPSGGAPSRPVTFPSPKTQPGGAASDVGAAVGTAAGKATAKPQTAGQPNKPDPEKQHFTKNPRQPSPYIERSEDEQEALNYYNQLAENKKALRAQFEKEKAEDLDFARKHVPKGNWSKVDKSQAAMKQRYDAKIKEIDEEMKHVRGRLEKAQDRRTAESKPREITNKQQVVDTKDEIKTYFEGVDHTDDSKPAPPEFKNSVLENLWTERDRKPLHDLALSIWQQNHQMTPEQAAQAALSITSISPTGKSPFNQGTGKDALQFTARRSPPRGYALTLSSGKRVYVDEDTWRAIDGLQQKNWRSHEEQQTEEGKRKAKLEKAKLGKKGAVRAMTDLIPSAPTPDRDVPSSPIPP